MLERPLSICYKVLLNYTPFYKPSSLVAGKFKYLFLKVHKAKGEVVNQKEEVKEWHIYQ